MHFVYILVPEVEGETDSISALCSQITSAFSTPSEDPFSSAPMTKPVTVVAPQSPAFQGLWFLCVPWSCWMRLECILCCFPVTCGLNFLCKSSILGECILLYSSCLFSFAVFLFLTKSSCTCHTIVTCKRDWLWDNGYFNVLPPEQQKP